MAFDWTKLASILLEVPKVVMGIETLVTGAKQGATKKDLAMASLGLASSVATDVFPSDVQPAITAATTLASTAIDNFVALMNSVGAFKKTPDATPVTNPIATPAATIEATTETIPVSQSIEPVARISRSRGR